MTFILRSFIYLFRNKKYVLLFLTITALMDVFLGASKLIDNGITQVENHFYEKVGPELYFQYQLEDDITDTRLWHADNRDHNIVFEKYYEVVDKYTNDNRVKEYQYSLYTFFLSDSLYIKKSDSIIDRNNYSTQQLYGVSNENYFDISLGKIKITDGRNISAEDIANNPNVCVVNSNLIKIQDGKEEEIQIGDIIPITIRVINSNNGNYTTAEEYVLAEKKLWLKVIGKYQKEESETAPTTIMNNTEKIYCCNGFIKEYDAKKRELENKFDIYKNTDYEKDNILTLGVKEVLIKLKNPEDVIPFGLEISKDLFDLNHNPNNLDSEGLPKTEYFHLVRSTDAYESLKWILKGLNKFSTVVKPVCLVLYICMISMLLKYFLKLREKEIGVLMSMGDTKIAWQIISEILFMSIIASMISISISYWLSGVISNSFLNMATNEGPINILNEINNVDYKDLISMYKISLSAIETLEMMMLEVLIPLAVSIFPIIIIIKQDVKKVLLD